VQADGAVGSDLAPVAPTRGSSRVESIQGAVSILPSARLDNEAFLPERQEEAIEGLTGLGERANLGDAELLEEPILERLEQAFPIPLTQSQEPPSRHPTPPQSGTFRLC
jgi:hypothetical protein